MTQDRIYSFVKALRAVLVVTLMLTSVMAMAQVKVSGDVYGGGNEANVGGSSIVVINVNPPTDGSKNVAGNVYGGGAKGIVNSSDGSNATANAITSVTLTKGIVQDVYGGGLGDDSHAANVFGTVTVTVNGGTARDVFGCNNVNGAPQSTVEVNISGGEVAQDVYGGGNLASTTVSPVVNISGGIVTRDVYGGGALANTGGSTVNVTGSTVTRNIYGGGLGRKATTDVAAIAALENGDVTVNIGKATVSGGTTSYSGDATIGGSVFGCNNANGSPTGNVVVNIYKTAHTTSTTNNQYPSTTPTSSELGSDNNELFALQAVYGGGNEAAYTPTTTGNSTTVTVYGCSENTVKAVYGGGNAADVGDGSVTANTNVIIQGGRFYQVFGGGNGQTTPANVYGTATTDIQGGLFNQIFGGSDSDGDVNVISLTVEDQCADPNLPEKVTLLVNESFGGANKSPITGNVTTNLYCTNSSNNIGSFYGGSNQADITGNVTLNVYGGVYENVFGGSKGVSGGTAANIKDNPETTEQEGNVTLNLYGGTITNAFGGSNLNGNIEGVITVNMLKLDGGSCPLTVNNIYGASNQTAYTPTFEPTSGTERISPVVNLIHGNSLQEG